MNWQELTSRAQFAWACTGLGRRTVIGVFAVLGAISTARDYFFPEENIALINLIPPFPLHAWAIIVLVLLFLFTMEGAFHIQADLRRQLNAHDSALKITLGSGKSFVQVNDSFIEAAVPLPIYGKLYTYRVAIVNESHKVLHDVEVRLTRLSPCPSNFNATGGYLLWKHDNPVHGHPHITKQSIPPTKQEDYSDAKFVDVIRCFWPDKEEERGYTRMEICHVVHGVSCNIPILPYSLDVTANDQAGDVTCCTFRIDVSGEGAPKLVLGERT